MSLWQGFRAWLFSRAAVGTATAFQQGKLTAEEADFISNMADLWMLRWDRMNSPLYPPPSLMMVMLQFALEYVEPVVSEAKRDNWPQKPHDIYMLFWAAILISRTHSRGQLQAALTEMGSM